MDTGELVAERSTASSSPGLATSSPSRDLAGRDDVLDGLRAVACLLVYFGHLALNPSWGPVGVLGYTGVHLFFVLSGYLMFGPFLGAFLGTRPWPGWRGYAIRRFTRIYPPYFVALVIFSWMRYLDGNHPPGPGSFISHALLVFNFTDVTEFYRILAVFWSLAIEAQFYAVLPLGVMLARRVFPERGRLAAWSVVIGFIVTGLAIRGLEYVGTSDSISAQINPRFRTVFAYLDMFGAGMMAACLAQGRRSELERRPMLRFALIGLGVVLFVASASWAKNVAPKGWFLGPDLFFTVVFPLSICLGGALVVLGVVTRPAGASCLPLDWRPLVLIGEISYSLYLYHLGVHVLAWKVFGRFGISPVGGTYHLLALALLALPPTLAFSALMYALVERPALRWGARYSLHRKRQGC